MNSQTSDGCNAATNNNPTDLRQDNSQQVTKIKREKDPRRVEAGKRLAAISKAAKERKMRERIKTERTEHNDLWFPSTWGTINYGFVIGFVGLLLAGVSLCYSWKNDKREETEKPTTPPPAPVQQGLLQNKEFAKSKVDTFD